ncbi:MAG TPA: dodecin family protein [Thermoanaerobaculia bacterium]|nr:dodecin family protein [Thermoanaerobaculia bacterium]HUM28615.1 dodecin family protein [Thermoanaerobaculia bacterium]HXK66777.1 dodecin family protein [Thermoanaerobaculia bacterium]
MKVYKKITLVGVSEKSVEDAIQLALAQASRTVKGLSWFEVGEIRGAVKEGKVMEYQVTLEAGFRVLEEG